MIELKIVKSYTFNLRMDMISNGALVICTPVKYMHNNQDNLTSENNYIYDYWNLDF